MDGSATQAALAEANADWLGAASASEIASPAYFCVSLFSPEAAQVGQQFVSWSVCVHFVWLRLVPWWRPVQDFSVVVCATQPADFSLLIFNRGCEHCCEFCLVPFPRSFPFFL